MTSVAGRVFGHHEPYGGWPHGYVCAVTQLRPRGLLRRLAHVNDGNWPSFVDGRQFLAWRVRPPAQCETEEIRHG